MSRRPTVAFDTLVGVAVYHWRTARGMSQVELAKRLAVGQSWLSRVESGALPLTVSNLTQLGEMIGVSSSRILADAHGCVRHLGKTVRVTHARREPDFLTAARAKVLLADSVDVRSIYQDAR